MSLLGSRTVLCGIMNELFQNKKVVSLNCKITLITWHDVLKYNWKQVECGSGSS